MSKPTFLPPKYPKMEKGLYQCDWETRVQTTIEVWGWSHESVKPWKDYWVLGEDEKKKEKGTLISDFTFNLLILI